MAAKNVQKKQKHKQERTAKSSPPMPHQLRNQLAVIKGFTLAAVDPAATPGFTGGKARGIKQAASDADHLASWQERLYAASRGGDTRSVLLVVQGMDTSGKGGIMRHVVGAVDPQGVRITAFKAPTPEERARGFLWRIRRALPEPGIIGVFDRSHYEDVLIVRVHHLAPKAVWQRRYTTINDFERRLADRGTTIVKVMLHISPDEQKTRLSERLARSDKYWKYRPGDLDERQYWDAYAEAYHVALTKCSPPHAPWFVVPADRKWYAQWAVQRLLIEHLAELNPQWPAADFDVATEQARLALDE
ncbi:MAG: PPK2 family polyphosphate kinase [Actinomycetota bacterium]